MEYGVLNESTHMNNYCNDYEQAPLTARDSINDVVVSGE